MCAIGSQKCDLQKCDPSLHVSDSERRRCHLLQWVSSFHPTQRFKFDLLKAGPLVDTAMTKLPRIKRPAQPFSLLLQPQCLFSNPEASQDDSLLSQCDIQTHTHVLQMFQVIADLSGEGCKSWPQDLITAHLVLVISVCVCLSLGLCVQSAWLC